MAEDKDYLGEKLRLAERAREDVYFRALDQALIAQMQQQARAEAAATAQQQAMFTPILVPVDFSECSKKALAYAIPLAKQFGATIDVVHVVPPYYALDPYGVAEYERVEKELLATGEQRLARLLLDMIPSGIAADIFVRTGKAAIEIVEVAKELEADLIILSTHGHTGLKHVILGSTAENVVRHAPCPVLTVREKEHEFIVN